MHEHVSSSVPYDVFSADEIAEAAGVDTEAVRNALAAGYVPSFREYVRTTDALILIRALSVDEIAITHERAPLSLLTERKRKGGAGLLASGAIHALAVLALLLVTSLGLLDATDSEVTIKDPVPQKLVFLVALGPGGGGGGGGLKMPTPPPKAQRKPLVKLIKRTPSPVPPVRRTPPPPPPPRPIPQRPPPPIEPPPQRVEPLVVEPPKPAPPAVVQAPVVPIPTDPVDMPGLMASRNTAAPSAGPGTGGGTGTGAGTGLGEGKGAGIGPGQGGGTGGGPYRPGTGIQPPTLIREVKPTYTDEARRRGIEGDVVLEIVVRRDGAVGDVQVRRSLGAGLEQRAIDAVRQWRFGPARREGTPVDVVVEVSVEFKLR